MTPAREDRSRGRVRVTDGAVLTPNGILHGDVLLVDGVIASIARRHGRRATGERSLPAGGLLVAPGLVDLQVNGGFGHDITSDPGSVWDVGRRLIRHGVTAFLPTVVSAPTGAVAAVLETVAGGSPPRYGGAVPLGVHCEGPMIAGSRRGAHERPHLRKPSLEVVAGWSRASGVRMVTMAPELAGARDVAVELRRRGVVVSAGHSDASYEQAEEALADGFAAGTHLFNAMSGFHHRRPGLAGALLAHPEAVAGLIVDGVHVHPAAVRLAWLAKGPGRLALVSDASAHAGARTGAARLGGAPIRLVSGAPRDDRGALAGSAISLDAAVRNLIRFIGCPVGDALVAATATPARLVGDEGRGRLAVGARADLVLLDPTLRVAATIAGGRVAFLRGRRGKEVP